MNKKINLKKREIIGHEYTVKHAMSSVYVLKPIYKDGKP